MKDELRLGPREGTIQASIVNQEHLPVEGHRPTPRLSFLPLDEGRKRQIFAAEQHEHER